MWAVIFATVFIISDFGKVCVGTPVGQQEELVMYVQGTYHKPSQSDSSQRSTVTHVSPVKDWVGLVHPGHAQCSERRPTAGQQISLEFSVLGFLQLRSPGKLKGRSHITHIVTDVVPIPAGIGGGLAVTGLHD